MEMKKYEKWNYSRSIPLRYLLSTYHRRTLWYMKINMAMNENKNNFFYQFQVGYILNPGLNIDRAFKELVESNTALTFGYK